MGGPFSWSVDPASNDTIDPDIFLAEGQPPPTLNNAVRAVMAGVAKARLDVSGAIVASGVASGAIAISTNQGATESTFDKDFEVGFRVTSPNGGPCTLNIDGVGPRAFRRPGNIALAPSDLLLGRVYLARWSVGLGYFTLVSPEPGASGEIRAFVTPQAVPPGWIECDGRVLSRTAYEALFAVLGTLFGEPTPTSFLIPDLRGRALFGADNMGTRGAAGRLTGAAGLAGAVGSQGGSESTALTAGQMPSHTHTGTAAEGGGGAAGTTGAGGGHDHGGSTGNGGSHSHTAGASSDGSHTHTGNTGTGGSHTHEQGYTIQTAGSGNTNRVVSDLQPTGVENGIGISKASGSHGHSFTTDAGGSHSHTITVGNAAEHAHSIPAAAAHTHSIPAAAAHTHPLSINNAGSGEAHPNVPPGLVVIWAIRG